MGSWRGLGITVSELRVQDGRRKALFVYTYTDPETGEVIALEEDDIALDRREDRNRLANAALAAAEGTGLGPVPEEIKKNQAALHALVRDVRDGAWETWTDLHKADWVDGATEETKPDWLVPDYVIRGAGTILYAPPGVGKSTMAMLMAQSVALGPNLYKNNLFNANEGSVLYVNLERSAESMQARLGQVNEVLGVERSTPLLMINARGSTLESVYDNAIRTIDEYAVDLVVLDSLSRAGGGSMIKDDDANEMMNMLNGFKCAWLALGHTPRGDSSHVFGSQMLTAAADLEVGLLGKEFRRGVTTMALNVTKANDTRKPPPVAFDAEYEAHGLTGVQRLMHEPNLEAFEEDDND